MVFGFTGVSLRPTKSHIQNRQSQFVNSIPTIRSRLGAHRDRTRAYLAGPIMQIDGRRTGTPGNDSRCHAFFAIRRVRYRSGARSKSAWAGEGGHPECGAARRPRCRTRTGRHGLHVCHLRRDTRLHGGDSVILVANTQRGPGPRRRLRDSSCVKSGTARGGSERSPLTLRHGNPSNLPNSTPRWPTGGISHLLVVS